MITLLNKKVNKYIILSLLFCLASCASSVKKDKKITISKSTWHYNIVNKPNHNLESLYILSAKEASISPQSIKYAKQYILEDMEALLEIWGLRANDICVKNKEFLLKELKKQFFILMDSKPIRYKSFQNNNTSTHKSSIETEGKNIFIKDRLFWTYGPIFNAPINASSLLKLSIYEDECSQNGSKFTIEINPTYEVVIPYTPFLLKEMINITISGKDVENRLENIPPTMLKNNSYNYFIKHTASIMRMMLKNRYQKKIAKIALDKEVISEISNEILLSRLQRKLKDFKYDKNNSRFSFQYKYCIESVCSKTNYTLSVFPESDKRSVILEKVSYEPIYDKQSKKIVFGKDNANSSIKSYRNFVNKIAKNVK